MTTTSIGSGAPIIVVGLGYGDEAKGATVDFLASRIPDTVAVVRWSGGAQAAHNVCHGGRHHTFRQFGSASFLDVRTVLRAPMMVNPLHLATEADELAAAGVAEPFGLITADAACLVTTPIHAALNRARELLRGNARHGSTGEGIGETQAYALAVAEQARAGTRVGNFCVHTDVGDVPAPRVADLTDRAAMIRSLDALARYAAPLLDAAAHPDTAHPGVAEMVDALGEIGESLRIVDDIDSHIVETMATGTVIYEGSQGVLLDEWNGFHPHTTWSTVVPGRLAKWLHAVGYAPFTLGLARCYATRHGIGPMPTEDDRLELPDVHNREGRYQGAWRTGHLDLPALRYAAVVSGGLDGVAVSHLDALGTPGLSVAHSWDHDEAPLHPVTEGDLDALSALTTRAATARPDYSPLPEAPDAVATLVEQATGVPVVITADGPHRADRTFTCPTIC